MQHPPRSRRELWRLGLQAKLVISFLLMMMTALGVSCWLFVSQSREWVSDVIGEQGRQLASTLALASQGSLQSDSHTTLDAIGRNLVKSRNVLFITFYDSSGKPIAHSSRDPDYVPQAVWMERSATQLLMQARRRESRLFGEHVAVIAPILRRAHVGSVQPASLLGYVEVGISEQADSAQMHRVRTLVIGVGCVIAMVSLPMSYLIVGQMFKPIHQLLTATREIIAGDLETRVAIDRPDVIGQLAHSFNEMAIWVKKQQQDVADANEKLSEANRDLEAKVEQRTAQLETANGRLSSEIAEKEDFLRAVSHDLNAPLRNISGMATMLMMKYGQQFDVDIKHRLERIKKNVDLETDLISELLELSRIKTRRQKMESVDLEQLAWELRGMFENDLKTRGIDLLIDTQLPVLDCERSRMRQVFQNLIDNAIKYMGDRFPREIHLGCKVGMTEAEFYVRDTGIGIDPEDIDKVFYVFRRGKNTAVQGVPGKGVGLASVKSIIETYNGKIWVESVLGQGSVFRFTINGKFVPFSGRGSAQLPPVRAA
ncbi:MAG: sensor histidine kinase [Tepidisphaeraceae bacterium]